MTGPPEAIHPQENIGRQLFSSSHYNRSGKVKYRAFLKKGYSRLSVDRLDHAQPGFLQRVGLSNAEKRGREFHGWATLTAEMASGDGRRLEWSPILPENPYHADVHMSPNATNDDEREEEAGKLARLSQRVKPDWAAPNRRTRTFP